MNCDICAIADTITTNGVNGAYVSQCEHCGFNVCRDCQYNEEHSPAENAQYFIDHARIDENGWQGE
jgi:hypothetical protein|tara:strand:+ start:98 stop:295 length:198 start_codon:yes stop_codon:yes gene_type:complete